MANLGSDSALVVYALRVAWRPDSPTDSSSQTEEALVQVSILDHDGRQLSYLGLDLLADWGIDGLVLDGCW